MKMNGFDKSGRVCVNAMWGGEWNTHDAFKMTFCFSLWMSFSFENQFIILHFWKFKFKMFSNLKTCKIWMKWGGCRRDDAVSNLCPPMAMISYHFGLPFWSLNVKLGTTNVMIVMATCWYVSLLMNYIVALPMKSRAGDTRSLPDCFANVLRTGKRF